jgi:hypothetical protein
MVLPSIDRVIEFAYHLISRKASLFVKRKEMLSYSYSLEQRMPERSKTAQRTTFHLTRYSYHEAGHAVVGHVMGRCLSEISIQRNKDLASRGYCAFDAFVESLHGLPQWKDGSKNPECITIMYAGSIAFKMLCELRQWKREHWRGSEKADFDTSYLWSLGMFETDDERLAMQRMCQQQAEGILKTRWHAVEALVTILLQQGWLTGGQAHTVIREALGETEPDWRLQGGRLLDGTLVAES